MTRIVLEEARTAGFPVVKRTAIGQVFNGAVLKAESRDRLKRSDDGTMVPIIKPNGNHAQELVVTCLTLPGTTAPVGLGDMEEVPEPGQIVRLILKGKSFGDWIEAKRALPNGTLGVGDVVTQTTTVAQVYDAQGNASGPEVTNQDAVVQAKMKGRSVGIYGPLTLDTPEANSEWTEKAVTAYRTMLASPEQNDLAAARSSWGDSAPAATGPARPASIPQKDWDAMSPATRVAVANSMDEPPF